MATPTSLWQALQATLAADPAAPRVTFYERTPGPTSGERIELSGKVLVNWVSKAANLLTEEFDVEPGSHVGLYLPAAHWRTAYWALAAWSVGATVRFVDSDAAATTRSADGAITSPANGAGPRLEETFDGCDVLVTTEPAHGFTGDQVVVTLAMLARQGAVGVPTGAIDEARELSTFGDIFDPLDEPDVDDVALEPGGATFAQLLPAADGAADQSSRRYLPDPAPADVVRTILAGGGVVIVRGAISDADLAPILAQESVTPA